MKFPLTSKARLYKLTVLFLPGVLFGCKSPSEAPVSVVVKAEPTQDAVKPEPTPDAVKPEPTSKLKVDSVPLAPIKENAKSTVSVPQPEVSVPKESKSSQVHSDKTKTVSASAQPRAGHEIEDVKTAVAGLDKIKGLDDLSDHLTNESAGAVAMPMILMISMMSGFGQMAADMSKGQPEAEKKLKMMNDISSSTNSILKKYEIDMKSPSPTDADVHKFESHGRSLLKEIGGQMDRLGNDSKISRSPLANKKFNPDTITYKIQSPTEVKLIPKNPEDYKDMPKDLSMRFEEGKWRLDFGGIKSTMNQMGKKQGGIPGVPGSNPFGGMFPGESRGGSVK